MTEHTKTPAVPTTMVNRIAPNVPPRSALNEAEITVIDRAVRDRPTIPAEKTLSHYLMKIAGLGGYLARVHDRLPGNTIMFSRRVVGWPMSAGMTAQLVTDARGMAIWRRGRPEALLHHSDQGSQYSSDQCQRLRADHGVTCSMSRSGNVWDNAAMESFFSSLKTERAVLQVSRTRDQARAKVFDSIERFHNPRHRHTTINYLSPMQFEQLAKAR